MSSRSRLAVGIGPECEACRVYEIPVALVKCLFLIGPYQSWFGHCEIKDHRNVKAGRALKSSELGCYFLHEAEGAENGTARGAERSWMVLER